MVSMKDIAKACGVSVATVSKALNDYSDIGTATRKKVHEAAERMGYYPNSSARALKTNRTYNLGVLFVDEANSGLTHDYFSHVLESFKVTAEEYGYVITFTSSNIAGRKTSYLEHCRYRGVDGVVIACIDFMEQAAQELLQSELPVVTIDHIFNNRMAVVSDNVRGMRDLTEYVFQKGHRKIAYIHGENTSVTRARLGSFHRTLAQYGLEVPEEYVIPSAYRDAMGAEKATLRLLDLPDPPTCILYPDDMSCLGGINAIRMKGLRMPDDISVAGYDGLLLSGVVDPPITTIWQDTKKIGSLAAQKLISLIEQPKTTLTEHLLVSGKFREGGSVADIN